MRSADAALARQVDDILEGAVFGDARFGRVMRRELTQRLEEAARARRPLRVFAGYDASRPDLHLGHTITLRKLRLFQDLGHEVYFLIGTLTAQIGDPSDRIQGRPRFDDDHIRRASATFANQAFLVLRAERAHVVQNGEWLDRLTLSEVLTLASAFTVQQVVSQRFIKARLERNDPVGLHEMFYALLQGYDAVHLRADVQVGTTGPLFNILAGRKLQATYGQRPCVALTYPVLHGTRGHTRMSKREGTHVALTEPPDDQLGKIMSIDDETMRQWIPLVSSWPAHEVRRRLTALDGGQVHPLDLKRDLALDIVGTFHGPVAAQAAWDRFDRVHRRREPAEPQPLPVPVPLPLLDALVRLERIRSRSEARRLLAGGGVRVDGEVVREGVRLVADGCVLRVGKRDAYRLVGEPPPGRPDTG